MIAVRGSRICSLLQSVGRRLAECVRTSDTVSRQGGDEFVMLLPEIEHPEVAASSARRILASLVSPHVVGDRLLHASATIGISIYPDDGSDAKTLITCADAAMYQGKERGRNTYQFFARSMNVRAVQ